MLGTIPGPKIRESHGPSIPGHQQTRASGNDVLITFYEMKTNTNISNENALIVKFQA
jgi:hypothetical protein